MSATSGMHVVVVGAGFGGLSAAAHLAKAGARVTVLEQADAVGGKAAHLARDGFTLDAGPTLLTMPWVVEETFAAAGVRLADVVTLTRVEPASRYILADGSDLVVSGDEGATRASIARVSPRDARNWGAFLAECKAVWEAAGEPYLEAPFEGYVGFSKRVLRRGAKAVKLGMQLGTLDDVARRYFESDTMRAFVGRFATYAGGSPTEASAAFAMIPYLEICLGAFYPQGGMHALAQALAAALQAKGVRVIARAAVTAITLDAAGRATGVTYTGPEGATAHLDADAVVANVDPLAVVSRLLPEARRRAAGLTELAARKPSLSGFAWAFGVEGDLPTEALHTVLFPRDYAEEHRAIFGRATIATEPTIYVSVPTILDPTRAPRGHHAVFALLNAPPTSETVDWEGEVPRLRAQTLARLERDWCKGLGARIRTEAFVTPRDIARTGSIGGAIYGAAPVGALAAFDRPMNRARGVMGLYYVGGATHPGGGVPLVMRGGRFVAELLESDARARRLPRVATSAVAGGAQ